MTNCWSKAVSQSRWQADSWPRYVSLTSVLDLSLYPAFKVLEALLDLHSRRIVHRDLKPENLLFYDNTENSKIVVVDFGLSEYEEELNEESPVCGTATYLAPEVISLPVINTITTSVLSQVIAQTESSRAQDLWSCGVITYIMVGGG